MTIKPQKKTLFPKILGLFSFAVFAFGFFLLPGNFAMAQGTTGDAAQVTQIKSVNSNIGVYNAKIVQTKDRTYTISFDIINFGLTQSGVKYGFKLVNKDDGKTYDLKVYDEVLEFSPSTQEKREVSYELPQNISGKFDMFVFIRNISGLELGLNYVDELNLEKGTSGIQIDLNSCYLTIPGEASAKKYSLMEGVDTLPAETLKINCNVENLGGNKLTFSYQYKNFERGISGKMVSGGAGESFSVGAKEKKFLSFNIKKADNPQYYDQQLTFVDANNNLISNPVFVHYIVAGEGASVRNAKLDKDYYNAGDTAVVSYFVTGSANQFVGSRNKSSSSGGVNYVLYVYDREGNSCSDQLRGTLKPESFISDINVAITKNCTDPSLNFKLEDPSGKLLDEQKFVVTTLETGLPWYAFVILALLVCVVMFMLYRRKYPAALTIFVIAISLLAIKGVNAGASGYLGTYGLHESQGSYSYVIVTGGSGVTIGFSVNSAFQKYPPEFAEGETVAVTTSMGLTYCANSDGGATANLLMANANMTLNDSSSSYSRRYGGVEVFNFIAKRASPSINVWGTSGLGATIDSGVSYTMPYSVSNQSPTAPTITLSSPAYCIENPTATKITMKSDDPDGSQVSYSIRYVYFANGVDASGGSYSATYPATGLVSDSSAQTVDFSGITTAIATKYKPLANGSIIYFVAYATDAAGSNSAETNGSLNIKNCNQIPVFYYFNSGKANFGENTTTFGAGEKVWLTLAASDADKEPITFSIDWNYNGATPNYSYTKTVTTFNSNGEVNLYGSDGSEHIYNTPGTYKVHAKCADSKGAPCNVEKDLTITVSAPSVSAYNGFRTSFLGKIFSTFGVKEADDISGIRFKLSTDGKTFVRTQ